MSGTTGPGDEVARAYDAWAEVYDADSNATRDLDAQAIRELPEELVRGDVLELGCGTGKNTVWLAARARSVLALDFSPGMLAKARERVTDPRARFARHDVREPLPAPDARFDLVTADLVLEHVADLGPVFREAARVLRPGGRLHVCELHPFRQLQGKQARFADPASGAVVKVRAHRHSVSSYLTAGLAAGLALEAAREIGNADDAPDAVPRVLALRFRALREGSAR